MNKSGVIFQPCDRNAMPDPDTLVLCMTDDNQAAIGQLWYDEPSGWFICSSEDGTLIVEKWAHIMPVELPDRLKDATEAAVEWFNSDFAGEEECADFFAGWDAAINSIRKQLA